MTDDDSHRLSIYVIKPEGMRFRKAIRELIISGGLRICQTRAGMLSEKHLRSLYPDLAPDLWRATVKFMRCGKCEVGLVEGDDAIVRLLDITGHSTNPNECEPRTVRNQFGAKLPDPVGSAMYYRNVIHRPKNCTEAKRDIALLSPFLSGLTV